MHWYQRAYQYWNRPGRCAYLFLAPSLILLFLFNILPLVMAFVRACLMPTSPCRR